MANIFLDRAQSWAYGARMADTDNHEPFLVGRADDTPTEAVGRAGWKLLYKYLDGSVLALGRAGYYTVAPNWSGPRATPCEARS